MMKLHHPRAPPEGEEKPLGWGALGKKQGTGNEGMVVKGAEVGKGTRAWLGRGRSRERPGVREWWVRVGKGAEVEVGKGS